MLNFLKQVFGSSQDRVIKKMQKIVNLVNDFDAKFMELNDAEIINKTSEFKERFKSGETLDSMLPEAYGLVKNVCRRMKGTQFSVSGYRQEWDMIPYDVQVIGAIAMHHGYIAEMQTGEGKTLTATMPLYLNALSGSSVHLVTVNDYLAQRDSQWVGEILRKLGLSTGVIINETPHESRKEIYNKDVIYITASELGFDYLRDNAIASSSKEQVMNGCYFAIIDEIDSILIDEARTPLIISGPSQRQNPTYLELKDAVFLLVKAQRDLCNKLALEARRELDEFLDQDVLPKDKKVLAFINNACKKLWLVSKGMPLNKIVRRVKEHPDLRAFIDKWDVFFSAEQNKHEASSFIAELYLVLDERGNEFELSDKGIQFWVDDVRGSRGDFIIPDLGAAFSSIDMDLDLEESEKITQKLALSQEETQCKERMHGLRQLLRAHLLMENNVDYIVDDGKIIIIDEHTGRPQPGRRFSDGLHQAIEAKENLEVQKETQTYASVTLQNFFRIYSKLAGMTGTAITEAAEFKDIYNLSVLQIPTFRPCARIDADDAFYMTEREKYVAILKEIIHINSLGRPILIGTESVDISEKVSRILRQNNLAHTVLNAKNHSNEAEIIAQAGLKGAITVATNMAGRGTDIKISKEVIELGGLHVIGTSRHQSRRIDRQLRGRCARLGDSGSSRFFLSFEDSLMRLFASPKMTALMQRFRPPEGEAMSDKMLNRMIESAQKRVEGRNYTIRKHTVDYDDVMNKQRHEVYNFRNDIIRSSNIQERAVELLYAVCSSMLDDGFSASGPINEGLATYIMEVFPISISVEKLQSLSKDQIENILCVEIKNAFECKLNSLKQEICEVDPRYDADGLCNYVITNVIISRVDRLWQEHLFEIDLLRSEVGLRAVAQKDPLIEFKNEAFKTFERFVGGLYMDVANHLFQLKIDVPRPVKKRPIGSSTSFNGEKIVIGNFSKDSSS